MMQLRLLRLSQGTDRPLIRNRIYLEFGRLFSETVVFDVDGDLITNIQGGVILHLLLHLDVVRRVLAFLVLHERRVRSVQSQSTCASLRLLLFLKSVILNVVLGNRHLFV